MQEAWLNPAMFITVITYNSSIAVCGGEGGERVVEVFNSESAQWHTTAPLPVACDGPNLYEVSKSQSRYIALCTKA